MFAVWAAVNLVKQVVIVDEDIDRRNIQEVEWAIATRAQAPRDYVIVPGVQADRSEPLERDGTIGKIVIIDATRRPGDRDDFVIAAPPAAAVATARTILQESGLALARRSIGFSR